MKNIKIYFFCILNLSGRTVFAQINDPIQSNTWMNQVTSQLQQEEYNISWDENLHAFQSPNRNQNLRGIYFEDHMILKPRVDTAANDNWEIDFDVLNISRVVSDREVITGKGEVNAKNDALTYHFQEFSIEYKNSSEGIRQNFYIQNKPEGRGNLCININTNTEFSILQINPKELAFTALRNNKVISVLRYKDIQAWDATGKILESAINISIINNKQIITLEIDDKLAVYPLFIDPISTTANWNVLGTQTSSYLGFSAKIVGDVNGDGFDDIVASAFLYDNGSTNEGRAYLYLGSAAGPATVPTWTGEINQSSAQFGFCVSGAGDVNNDGYDDVLIGANKFDNGQTDEGRVYLYNGNATGLSAIASWTYELNQTSASLGAANACAGDVNNDGFDDVIIGAANYNNGIVSDAGIVSIFLGSAGGLSASPVLSIGGLITEGKLGSSVSTAGDINGDGYDDIIYGEEEFTFGETDEGRVYMHYGSLSGPSLFADWSFQSNQSSAHLGNAISTAGDLNADGYDDIIVAAKDYNASLAITNSGIVYAFYGSASGFSGFPDWTMQGSYSNDALGYRVCGGGDVNDDGFDDIIITADQINGSSQGKNFLFIGTETLPYGDPSWSFSSYVQSSYFYDTGLSNGGDVNGDGLDDILIGDYVYSTSSGQLYLFYGSAILPLIFADYNTSIIQSTCLFGYSLAGGGDINNDGFDDLVIAAPNFDNGSVDEGKVFCFNGNAFGIDTFYSSTVESNQDYAAFGSSIDFIGDYNNDNYDDIIIGSPLYNYLFSDEGRVFIYKGTATGINYLPSKTFQGGQASAKLGFAVSAAGDVNHDGFSDILMAAPYFDEGITDQGKIYIYKSTGSGFSALPFFTAKGTQLNSNFGFSLNEIVNLNGDEYADIIIGEPGYDNIVSNTGKALLYYGGITMSPIAAWSCLGEQAESKLGYSVNNAGDVNADGYDDLLIGQPLFDNGQTDEGKALLFLGNATIPDATPHWVSESNITNAQYGFSLAGIGDFNNDNYSDIFVGGIKNEYTVNDEGTGSLFLGSHFGLDKIANGVLHSGQANAQLGFYVTGAGDLNNDGFDDIAASAPYFDNGLTDQGLVFILLGDSVTCISIPDFTDIIVDTNSATITISDPDPGKRFDFRWRKIYETIWQYDSSSADIPISITGLEPCNIYILELQKVCLTGSSNWILIDTIETPGCPMICDAYSIEDITITGITNTMATLNWLDPGPVLNFEITYRKSGVGAWITLISYENFYSFTGLDSCSNYEFQIRSNCSGDFGPWSIIMNFTTDGCIASCEIPGGLTATDITSNSAKLNWNIVSGATSYKISYRQTPGGSWINTNAVSNFKNITGLLANTNYQFKVKAICGATSSGFSPLASFTTLLRDAQYETSPEILIYPNPGDQFITCNIIGAQIGDLEIQISDIFGQILHYESNEVAAIDNISRSINVSNIPSGLYLFQIKNANKITTAKIQIIH